MSHLKLGARAGSLRACLAPSVPVSVGITEEKKEALGKVIKTAQFLGGLGERRVGASWDDPNRMETRLMKREGQTWTTSYKDRLNLLLCLVRE